MSARRVDHRVFNAGSTPTTSRMGRLRGSVPGRAANANPSGARCFSSAVLYVSDAATVALNSTRPSIESHRPSWVWTLFATAT